MQNITYDVRIYKTETRKNADGKVTSYRVLWRVAGKPWKKPFQKQAQADAYRSTLVAAARTGEAFSLATGEPVSWERVEQVMSWYDFACKFTDMKWKGASANYRADIARALTAATPAMISGQRGKPADEMIRTALKRWAFNTKQRPHAPVDIADTLRWLAANTHPVSALANAATLRGVLDTATSRLDGSRSATSTVLRNKAILHNALEYAVELKLLTRNPLKDLKWKPPKTTYEVDRRSVVNHDQARALLEAVRKHQRSGPRLVAFFALMYYAALRPEEAVNLREHNLTLPALVWNAEAQQWEEPADGWGELHFATAAPFVGREWTDDGTLREERSLKHRANGHSRSVPCAPELTRILRAHLAEFGTGPGGRLFRGVGGGDLPAITC